MDIRYIYIHRGNVVTQSQWMHKSDDNVPEQALYHVSDVMRCSALVVERDPSTGYMVPLGFAAVL